MQKQTKPIKSMVFALTRFLQRLSKLKMHMNTKYQDNKKKKRPGKQQTKKIHQGEHWQNEEKIASLRCKQKQHAQWLCTQLFPRKAFIKTVIFNFFNNNMNKQRDEFLRCKQKQRAPRLVPAELNICFCAAAREKALGKSRRSQETSQSPKLQKTSKLQFSWKS